MQALLASPSDFSPPASPNSSFPSSPQLPDLASPFSNAALENWAKESPNNTPTRQIAPPAWVTDELEEEWIEEDQDDQDDLTAEQEPFIDESCDSSNEETTKMNDSLYATPRTDSHSIVDDSVLHTRPRIPSSLRFSLSTNSQPTSNIAPASSIVSPAGTFVFREGDSSIAYRDGEENQLQAAVKALRGPAGGLGGAPVAEDVEEGEVVTPVKAKKNVDRLGGLLGLFEPPKSKIGQFIVRHFFFIVLTRRVQHHHLNQLPVRSHLTSRRPLKHRERRGNRFPIFPRLTPLLPSPSTLSLCPMTTRRPATPFQRLQRQNQKIVTSARSMFSPQLLPLPPHQRPPTALRSQLLQHLHPSTMLIRQNHSARLNIESSNSSTTPSREIISLRS